MCRHLRPEGGSWEEAVDRLVEMALEEDVGRGDWTTLWTVDEGKVGLGEVVAKERLVVAGTEAARRVFKRVCAELEVSVRAPDGAVVNMDEVILSVRGPLRGVLTAERTALNFLARLSGIATSTRRFVEATAGTGVKILDTRKTTPGWRLLEKEAVRAGGGWNHRMGLYDMLLVKDNHRAAAGGVGEAIRRVRARNTEGLPVEVEVDTLEELEEAFRLGVERVLLDNMPLPVLAEAVRRARALGESRPLLEASGNVSLERVRAVAETGVDFISVGALTHSARAADLSLVIVEVG